MKLYTRLAVAITVMLALASIASAQMKSDHRLSSRPVTHSQSAQSAATTSQWTLINNQPCAGSNPCFPAGMTMLLTDGTILVHEEQDSGNGYLGEVHWYKLTPDIFGNYVNGTWSQVADIPSALVYAPLFFGSQVLPDGRLTVIGGEYNFAIGCSNGCWVTNGAIYDPVANTWTNVPPPAGWTTIGDAQSILLNNGTYMQANCCTKQWAYLNPTTLAWTPFNGNGKFDVFDEEGWNLLPNGKVLTVDAYVFQYDPIGMNSELYDPSNQSWSSAGSTQVQLWDSACGNSNNHPRPTFELGPAVLRPDGTVFATGSTQGCRAGHNAIYDSHTGAWTAGPDFPGNISIADGAASIETNGKVLMMASVDENPPATFFEWDGANLTAIPGPAGVANAGSFYGHLLPLPTGQILYTDWNYPGFGVPTDVSVFTPAGTYNPAWAPKILAANTSLKRGTSYVLYGTQLAGVSQGGAYGDDYQPNTNYALVRLTNNATHHVFYCRTHNPSSYAVQSSAVQFTHFDVPVGAETGLSTLEAVTNGIPSAPIHVVVH